MAEISAYNRRHTPRHSVDYAYAHHRHDDDTTLLVGARDRLDALTSDGGDTGGGGGPPRVELSRSHSDSKTRKPERTTTIARPVAGATASRKMSGAQLRVFFLLCASLYLAVICFADDIVRFAQWVGDEDETTAVWRAAIAVPTPTPTSSKAKDHIKKEMRPSVVETKTVSSRAAPEATTAEMEGKKGNLRGDQDTTTKPMASAPVEATQRVDAEPTTAPVKEIVKEKETETMRPAKTTRPSDPVTTASVVGKPVVTETELPTSVPVQKSGGQRLEDVPLETKASHHAVEKEAALEAKADERDAPLDSVEERETRVERTASPAPTLPEPTQSTTEALPASAEIPVTPVTTRVMAAPAKVSSAVTESLSMRPTTHIVRDDEMVLPRDADHGDGALHPDAW